MKQYLKHENLPWLTLIAGGIGLLLNIWLLSTEDEKGFVARSHISQILLLLLTAAFLAVLFTATRALLQGNKYPFNFPASTVGAAGALLAAVGFGITSLVDLVTAADRLVLAASLVGLLAAAALGFAAHSRWKGLHPSMLFHGVICIYLMLRLICMYRNWSSDPQLEDYCAQLLAIVCAMLAAYHRATFDANFGRRAAHTFYSLAAVYFCCLSLAGPSAVVFYLSMGIWLLTDLCNLTPMPREFRREGKQ